MEASPVRQFCPQGLVVAQHLRAVLLLRHALADLAQRHAVVAVFAEQAEQLAVRVDRRARPCTVR